MRTSRVARDTARFVAALSPRSTRSRHIQAPKSRVNGSESDVHGQAASPASSAPSDDLDESPWMPSESSTRKRKRGADIVARHVKEETSITTATPREGRVPKITAPKKARRQPAKKVVVQNGNVKIEPPANWEKVYNLTREMRSEWQAPVDTMGCETLAEEHRSPRDKRFQTLVSLMLSSQTKDTVTAVAMRNLQQNLPGGLTIESILAVEPATLNEMISKVGFHNNKTKYIKAAAEILRSTYDSDIPPTIEGLVSLPGVGPKMAYLCMSAAWGRDEGIGVDVHVHRITNLWGWHKTKEPEETRAVLESWLPKDKWHDINTLLVGFGQTWCPPVGRKCEECKLSAEGLCPSAVVSKSFKAKVKKENIVVKDEDRNEETLVKSRQVLDLETGAIKAEELESQQPLPMNGAVQDIEDIGGHSRRLRRLAR